MQSTKTLQRFFFRYWRPTLLVTTLALIAYLLYFRHLGTLLPGYSAAELATYARSSNWHTIATNPLNAPFTIPVWLLTAVTHHGPLMTRVVAACYGVLAVVAFFAVVRTRHQFRIAALGTLLFATSAGLLHAARLGTPQILQMGLLALLAVAIWYRRSHHRTIVGYITLGLLALLWYIPGMVWFELLGCILIWRSLWGQLRRTAPLHIVGSCAVFLAVLVPLIMACVRDPHLVLAAAGLPEHFGNASNIAKNFAHTLLAVGIQGRGDPSYWVGHAALLNVAERILLVLGLYVYLYRERSLRAVFLAGATAVSVVLISLGGGVGFAALVPLLYLFIVQGLDHLLGRWFVVFPRNPVARNIGVAVICVMLFFSILYQVRIYFVAWPNAAATRQTFNLPPS